MAVNKSIPKIDGLGLVMGKPAYTNDLAPEGSLIVKALRSPHPHPFSSPEVCVTDIF